MAQLGTVISLTVRTLYAIASASNARPGTIGLLFSTGGSATFTTIFGDTVTITSVAGQALETGPLASVGTVPAGTVGIVSR